MATVLKHKQVSNQATCLLSSHRSPINPEKHSQVNPPIFVGKHCPPFMHGF